ncbi:membrane-associated protein [Streptacidiphilus sp. MAP12-33]|uniref:DedA family protein n=1 Tax=Streptacidiphilus sp. MAP12-33 TaxID=3156266 RepID=UPI00351113F2
MSWISDHLLALNGTLVLIAVFLLPALESSVFLGFLIPGETAVVIGGVTAYNGRTALWAVLLVAILGAVIGDGIGYAVGKRWGNTLLARLPQRLVKPASIRQSKELIRRLGGKAVFAGRFAAALRALVPGLCGVSEMPYRTFARWNLLGGAVWATGFVLLGYFAGAGWHQVEHYASVVSWVAVGVAALGVVGLVLLKRRAEKKAETWLDESESENTTRPESSAV